MNSKRLYLDMHALQILPPSCVNRDDTNTPKTCVYGGKTRARVSSQCWKKAIRDYFRSHNITDVGIRTKKFKSCIEDRLMKNYSFSEEEAAKASEVAVKQSKVVSEKENAKSVIAFFSEKEMEEFAKVIADNKDEFTNSKSVSKEVIKQLVDAIRNNPSTDMLLFGRMFASDPSLDYDASCQVAHAISVNEARTEYDYFTAVDDIPDESNNGSAFLDTKQFTDPIFYRYANINLSDTSELVKYDKESAAKAARDFLEAFVFSMPTGSVNGYANNTLPDYILVSLREDTPVNFAPAFIKTVGSDDFETEAENLLDSYADKISEKYGAPAFAISLKDTPFNKMLEKVEEEINRRL